VLWTTPVLQSALAPASAASGPCTVACPAGSPCANNTNCGPGTICINGTCLIPYGGTGVCTASSQCQSGNCYNGHCIASWPQTACTADSQCLSGKCNGGLCFENGLGAYCRTTTDCTDNTMCGGSPPTCGGTGAPCANANKCLSGKCKNGVCVA
jgi:hypothetical protein